MTYNQEFSESQEVNMPMFENEIDLKKLFNTLKRNRRLIAKFTLLGLVFSTFYALILKRTWQGEFQIVIDTKEEERSLPLPGLAKLAGFNSNSKLLETEVEVLKSPSVLMSVFDFVKNKKFIDDNRAYKKMRFKDWKKKNLKIDLLKDTSVLNLSYRDKDKDLILPVLKQISNAYQEYSGRKRRREIELGINFYENQIEIFNNKSISSLKEVQQFEIDQDLIYLKEDIDGADNLASYVNIEAMRIEAANKIRLIDQQLAQIQNSEGRIEDIIYLSLKVPSLNDLAVRLKTIESVLASKLLKYKENDRKIKDLKVEKEFISGLLEKQLKGFLLAEKADNQSQLKAAERPEGVLIKYKQLLSKAFKDERTLNKLENEYRVLLLNQARSTDPWELITTPTILPNPVAPEKKKIVLLGILSGLFFGCAASLISEKRTGIIHSIDEFGSLTKWPLLTELYLNEKQSINESLELLNTGTFSNFDGSIGFIIIGEIDEPELELFNLSIKKVLKDREFVITKELLKVIEYSNFVIVTSLGMTQKEEFIKISKKLQLQRKSVLGLIVLNNIN